MKVEVLVLVGREKRRRVEVESRQQVSNRLAVSGAGSGMVIGKGYWGDELRDWVHLGRTWGVGGVGPPGFSPETPDKREVEQTIKQQLTRRIPKQRQRSQMKQHPTQP